MTRGIYGLWRCADGREVLFDREYDPIMARRPGGRTVLLDRDDRPKDIVKEEILCPDGRQSSATWRKLDRLLASWRLP